MRVDRLWDHSKFRFLLLSVLVIWPLTRLVARARASLPESITILTGSRDALGEGHAMRDRARHEAKAFDRTARFAWKRDHERLLHDRGEITGKDRVRCYLHRLGRITSPKPGSSTRISPRIASGVMSRAAMPVPPVVRIRPQPCARKSGSFPGVGQFRQAQWLHRPRSSHISALLPSKPDPRGRRIHRGWRDRKR